MQYRPDKKSGNKLSVLGFGCMRLPGTLGNIDLQKAEGVIMEAVNRGVNFFDTAYIYPGSEAALGYILDKNKVRHKVFIGTKLPLFKCHSYEDFDRIFNIQLERLKTDYIDYYFIHNLTKLPDWERVCGFGIEKWLQEKREAGQIKQIGFSFHGTKNAFPVLIDSYNWDFCMIQYNYVNVNYQAGEAGLKYAHSKDMAVFIMEPLLGGRLAKDLPKEAVKLFTDKAAKPLCSSQSESRFPEQDKAAKPLCSSQSESRFPEQDKAAKPLCSSQSESRFPEQDKAADSTPASWALRWLWNQPEITLVLSGMNTIEQVAENTIPAAKAKAGEMPEEDMEVLRKAAKVFSSTYKIPCTGCNYCLPCPKKINIPDSFMAYNASYTFGRFTGIKQYATTIGGLIKDFSVTDCTKCGQCEKACPQEIKITERLKDVQKRMEPWWFRAGMAIARRVMK